MSSDHGDSRVEVYAPHFDQCTDDGPFDEMAWSSFGHHAPSLPLLMRVARAISYDTGYGAAEVKDLLRTVRWSMGYVGEHPSKYDLIPCEADGESTEYDDNDELVYCTKVRPATWAIVKADAAHSAQDQA